MFFSLFFLQMNGPGSLFAPESFLGISSHPRNDFGNFFGSAVSKPPSSVTPRHPLEATHELRQACQICFVKSGQDQTKEQTVLNSSIMWEFWGPPGGAAVRFARSALAAQGSPVRIPGVDMALLGSPCCGRRPT